MTFHYALEEQLAKEREENQKLREEMETLVTSNRMLVKLIADEHDKVVLLEDSLKEARPYDGE